MNALETLVNADTSLAKTLNLVTRTTSFSNKQIDSQIKKLTSSIEEEFKVDYTKTFIFKPKEKEQLIKIFIDYLTGKSDDFNSHYIQLLAWHLLELKIIDTKTGYNLSIFEYSPNPLAIYTFIEKTFKLFQKKRIDTDKISYALLLTYLNNYKIASNRYKNELKKFLKSIKFSEDLDIYFNFNNAINYTYIKTAKKLPPTYTYPERLLRLNIKPKTLNTIYFAESWFIWMINYADLTSDYIIRNINCSYFKICNQDCQRIILAKIIHINSLLLNNQSGTELICTSFIFPAITEGNPFKKEFWNLNYTNVYKLYLDSAWYFIQQTFVN